jgi:hypothetical protein
MKRPHPGRKPSQRPHYLPRVGKIARGLEPGTFTHVVVRHDGWCRHWTGGACNCAPTVALADAPPVDPASN